MEKISTQIPKLLLSLVCLFVFYSGGFSQNKADLVQKTPKPKQATFTTPALSQKSGPNDLPKYVDTGNPQADRDRYKQAKMAWIAKNPNRYAQMQKPPVSNLRRSDFEKLPEARQKQVLAHPERYKIVEDNH